MDPVEGLLWEALDSEQPDRTELAALVAAGGAMPEVIGKVRRHFPEWRLGQAWCNVLRVADPAAYLELAGTDIDPFYRDDRVPDFLAWLEARSVAGS